MRDAVLIHPAIVVVLLPSLASPQARVERNVVYGMHSETALLLDVHYPAAPNALRLSACRAVDGQRSPTIVRRG